MLTTELIDSIRGQLDGRASSVSPELLALEYAKQCREVNERLGKIGLMLEGGGEIQALQLAEQSPRVVDTALALSFGGESSWQEFCRNHEHENAPWIDARTLESLLSIQSKGIASNHPLYKDYRAAVSSRDDVRAHDLIRVIARMNPGDENAGKELKRFERKALQAALKNLREQLDAGDELLLTAMFQVEEVGRAEDYEGLQEWKQAAAVRSRVRRTEAWKRMPEALTHAEEELKRSEWRQAAVSHGEYAALANTYGHGEAAAGLEERARLVEAALEKFRAEAERQAKARKLVAEMERIADEVETRMVTPLGLSPDFTAPLVEDLARKMRQLEGLRGDLPNNSRQRIESARAQLSQALERSTRSRRLRIIAGLAALIIILLVAAGIGTLAFRASGHADLLSSLRAKPSTSGVRNLIAQIHEESILLKFTRLSAEVAESSRWLEALDAKWAIMDRELKALEDSRHGDFSDVPSPDLFSKLQEIGAMVSELPPDLAAEASSRLTVLRNEGERVLTKRQEENDRKAREVASRWADVLKSIDLNGRAAQASEAISQASTELAPFIKLAALEQPLLRLPASTEAEIKDVDSRVRQMMERADTAITAVAALKNTESSDAYRIALSRLAACSFNEAIGAQRVIDAWPDDERVKAMLVFRGDLVALKAASTDDILSTPKPEAAGAPDRKVISELVSSEVLNSLWEVVWKDGKGVERKALSQGELESTGVKEWKGNLMAYPKLTSDSLKFKERFIRPYEGNVLISKQPTATAEMMSQLDLARLLDDTGTKFRASVLPLLETVANNTKAKPLAKAYVVGQLLSQIRNHKPEEWGLFYCPGLIDDMKDFEALSMKMPLRESAWLLEKEPDSAVVWQKYFEERGKRATFEEFRKTQTAAKAVLRNPVDLAGQVTMDGAIVLKPASEKRLILAVCDLGDDVLGLKVCGIVDAQSVEINSTPGLTPMSPLLSINLPDETQSFLLAIHLNERNSKPNTRKP